VIDPAGQVVGIIDEGDILHRVVDDEDRFGDRVASAMTSRLQTIAVDAPMEALAPIFERDLVAMVMEDDSFLGLITRIDLLNHLRRKLKEA
jgi:cystathionine beta-synthase